MSLLSRWLPRLGRRPLPPLPPRAFLNQNFERIGKDQKIEEESIPDYVAARYYPVHIGEVFASRYQVVGKLGFGTCSTVWLARDLNQHSHVALKIFIRSQSQSSGSQVEHELNMYKHIKRTSSSHPGRDALRALLDSFSISGPDGEHQCLVHPPLWDSVRTFLARNSAGRLPRPVLGIVLQRLFLALDFMHNECHLIHTDIKADNIMFGIEDDSVFEEFENMEMNNPCPRKEVDGRLIYVSRALAIPKKFGPPVLCDLGNAMSGMEEHLEDVQPDIYRAPEIILEVPWTYPIDIWNAGCMIWDIYEGGHMFYGTDPEHHTYRGRAHLAEMIALLGPPPPELLARAQLKTKFFSEDGEFNAGIGLPVSRSLEEIETNLDGSDKEQFLHFMRMMLQWVPENRCTAKELFDNAWLQKQA